MNYKQLTENERYQIDAMNKAGHSQKEIAEWLASSASKIICTRTYGWHPGPATSAVSTMIVVASSSIALIMMNSRRSWSRVVISAIGKVTSSWAKVESASC